MPSSTFNSSGDVEGPAWARLWAVSVGLALLAVGSWEITLRARGFSPSVVLDHALWTLQYRRLRPDDVVLLGSSRIMAAIDSKTLAAALGGRPTLQLGRDGGNSPVPPLLELASNPSFRGQVICEVSPLHFFDASGSTSRAAEDLLAQSRRIGALSLVERRLRAWVQGRLACLNPDVAAMDLVRGRRNLSKPVAVFYGEDLSIRMRYRLWSQRSLEALLRSHEKSYNENYRVPTSLELKAQLEKIKRAVLAIRARGGDVVFLRLPSSSVIHRAEERRLPRQLYWDALARGSGGIAIHFEDHAELARFDCKDGAHLAEEDRVAFSASLGRILVRKLKSIRR